MLAPGALGLKTDSFSARQRGVERARQADPRRRADGRRPAAHRLRVGVVRRPYRERERVVSSRLSAESHTIPVTIAAEQGAIGLAAYGFLLWTAFAVAFGGLRRTLRRRAAGVVLVGRCVVAAAFCALLLHTFVYAAFLEDPLTWTLLAMAAALRRVEPDGAAAAEPRAARRAAPSRFRPEPFLPLTGAPPHRRDRSGRCDGPRGGGGRGGRLSDLPRARGRPADPAGDARRRLTRRCAGVPKPAPPKPQADDFVWRHYGYSKDHRRFFAPPGLLPRPVPGRLEAQGAGAARVPARDGERVDLPARRQRPAGVAAQEDRQGALEEEARAARGVGPRARRRARLRDAARRRPRRRAAAGSSRCASATASAAGRGRCRAAASPRRCCTTGGSTSARRTGRSTASTPTTAR